MICTEHEACNKKTCPMLAGKCLGSECMAWRWSVKPNVRRVKTMGSLEIAAITGRRLEGEFSSEEAYSSAFDAYMESALCHPEVKRRLSNVSDEWSLDGAPRYDEERAVLVQRLVRDFDPMAAGYCGRAPIQPIKEESND